MRRDNRPTIKRLYRAALFAAVRGAAAAAGSSVVALAVWAWQR